jgi:8-oxo-dGTP diphosphatase
MPKSDQGTPTLPARYTVIPRVLVFVYHGADVLLLKGAPDKRLWANRYNGLGGHVEPGEGIVDAARREVKEEAGLEVHDLRLHGVVHIDLNVSPGILMFVFSACSETRETRPSPEGSLHWLSPDALGEVDLVEDVPVLLERLAREEERPFTARYHYDTEDHLQIELGS